MNAAPALTAERLPFGIRMGVEDDHPFVMDSWLLSERASRGHEEGPYFVRLQKRMQRNILARGDTRLLIAYPDGEPDVITGWAAIAPRVIYYVYVSEPARRLGIARMLTEDADPTWVAYCARPKRTWDERASQWRSHPVLQKIPAHWHYLPRCNFLEP